MVELIRAFSEIEERDLASVGGKALSLGSLARAGFDVPPGFALTTAAFERFLAQKELASARPKLDNGPPSQEELASFRGLLLDAPMPAEIGDALSAAYERHLQGIVGVAVRSSGTREDMAGASFAGQYETILDVRGPQELERAVKRCWASLWQPRVLEYARTRGGGTDGLAMSVVVQELFPAEVAGVLFTVNPLTGREREVLIESVFGLGESLVSGKVNADRFLVDIESGEVLDGEVAEKSLAIRRGEKGPREVELEGDERRRPTLEKPELSRLAELASRIQEHYGRPMDVEWAMADGEIAVLQARPITHISFAPELGEWTTADFRDGGVSSGVCCPYMWSLYEYAFENSMPQYFKELKLVPRDHQATWVKMFFARPYWNMGEVKRALEPTPGYSEDSFHADLGIESDPDNPGKTTPVTVLGVIKALPVLFALNRSYKERLAKNRAYVAAFDKRRRRFDRDPEELRALSRDELTRLYRELVESFYLDTETSYFYTIYNTSNSKLDLKPAFEKVKAACHGELDELTLVAGLKDLSHLRPMKDMHRRLSKVRASGGEITDEEVAAFAERWKYHGRKELDIRVPRWKDDPAFVREMLERALEAFDPEDDPDRQEKKQYGEYEQALARARRALRTRPLLRRSFEKKLSLVRSYAWWREEMRDHSSYLYYLVRLWAVEVARRLCEEGLLEREDDIWYLSWRQSLAVLRKEIGAKEARELVRRGRRLLRWFENFENPNEIGVRYGFEEAEAPAAGAALRGTGCSAGRVTGRAKVVGDLGEAAKLEKGDILVTRFTDPGWTPLFSRISAVVTETGGVLSHAAVIAREYGIPAVLAVSGATRAISDGDTITVDGTRGTVEQDS